MLKGLNHITVAVNNLEESFTFYTTVLGMRAKAKWSMGAYLVLGDLWFCLNTDKSKPSCDYSHIAFDIKEEDFYEMKKNLEKNKVKFWKENSSEGNSLYILDPNNFKLEIHVGTLQSRLDSLKEKPFKDLILY